MTPMSIVFFAAISLLLLIPCYQSADCSKRPSLIAIKADNKTDFTDSITDAYNSWNSSVRMGFNSAFTQIRNIIYTNTTYKYPADKINALIAVCQAYNKNNPNAQLVLFKVDIYRWCGNVSDFVNCGNATNATASSTTASVDLCGATTFIATTPLLTTILVTTAAPPTTTTLASTSVAPTTVVPTTIAVTTAAPTTIAPTTAVPTTIAVTTAAPTTIAPSTAGLTTNLPTSVAPPSTLLPTVQVSTVAASTLVPSTVAVSTVSVPVSSIPTVTVPALSTVAASSSLPSVTTPSVPTVTVGSTSVPVTVPTVSTVQLTSASTPALSTSVAPTSAVPSSTPEPPTSVVTTLPTTQVPSTSVLPTTVPPTTLAITLSTLLASTVTPTPANQCQQPASTASVIFNTADNQIAKDTTPQATCSCTNPLSKAFYQSVSDPNPFGSAIAAITVTCNTIDQFCMCTESGECFTQTGGSLQSVSIYPFCQSADCHMYAVVNDALDGSNSLQGDTGTSYISTDQCTDSSCSAFKDFPATGYLKPVSAGCDGCPLLKTATCLGPLTV